VLQAIRQWDQALRERNEYRDALAKVQRQHEEAVKEINQAMAVRIKVSRPSFPKINSQYIELDASYRLTVQIHKKLCSRAFHQTVQYL
jgi:hypothetical protein